MALVLCEKIVQVLYLFGFCKYGKFGHNFFAFLFGFPIKFPNQKVGQRKAEKL